MPDDLQLFQNKLRIQREGSQGDGGDDSVVLDVRTAGASLTRDIAGIQERFDPFRTRVFSDVVHEAHEFEIRGNVRSGGFVRWLLEAITVANGTERGLDVREIPYDAARAPTFAAQFDGVEGTATYTAAALRTLTIEQRATRKATYRASFVALAKSTTESAWATTDTEAGDILATRQGRVSMANDLGGAPASHVVTGYEASIEIGFPELEAAQFGPDGEAQGFDRESNYDVTGRIVLPETSGITDTALGSRWNGELNLRFGTGSAGTALEIELGIMGMIERRTAMGRDWKEAQFDFVARRAANEPVARILSDQPEF